MRKSELIACTANVLSSQAQAAKVVDAFLQTIVEAVASGDNVIFPDFGTFSSVERPGRKGRNPRTGEEITIPARRTVSFTPVSALKKAITDYTL